MVKKPARHKLVAPFFDFVKENFNGGAPVREADFVFHDYQNDVPTVG